MLECGEAHRADDRGAGGVAQGPSIFCPEHYKRKQNPYSRLGAERSLEVEEGGSGRSSRPFGSGSLE